MAAPASHQRVELEEEPASPEAGNQNRQALESKMKKQLRDINAILTKRPDARRPVLDYLMDCGYHKARADPLLESKQSKALAKSKATRKKQAADARDDDGGTKIPTRYSTLGVVEGGGLSPAILREKVLPAVNRISLSVGNLASLHTRKTPAPTVKEDLARLCEFVSGLDRTFGLRGKYRQWAEFLNHFGQQSAARGRSDDLVLPVSDWSKSGVYELIENKNPEYVVVGHRFNDEKHTLCAAEIVDQIGSFNFKDLVIGQNWHERKAEIVMSETLEGQGFCIGKYFNRHVCLQKRSLTAIKDDPKTPSTGRRKRRREQGSPTDGSP